MVAGKLRFVQGASPLALCVGLAIAGGANAQPAGPAQSVSQGQTPNAAASAESSNVLGEIVVTARRTAENVEKVPIAVTAHTGAQIDQLVVNSVQDLNKLSPGLQVTAASATRETNQPSIRAQGTSFGTGQSSVLSYFAEVPNFQASVMDLGNLQVIKGPQGTLFGGTATGGVLLYEPKRPSGNELSGYITGEFGDFAYKSVEAALGGAIIPDVLTVRGALKLRRRHGFTTAVQSWGGTTDADNVDTNEWRLSALFNPTENFQDYLVYAGSYNASHGNSSPLGYVDNNFMNPAIRNVPISLVPSLAAAYLFETGVAPAPGLSLAQMQTLEYAKQIAAGPRVTFWNYSHKSAREFNGIVNQTRWDVLDNLTVRNIFGYQWRRSRGPSIDVDAGDLPIVDTRNVVTPSTTNLYAPQYAWVGGNPARELSEELQFQGKLFSDRLNWQLGGFYDRQSNPDFTPNSTIWVFTSLASAPDPVNRATCVPLTGTGPTQCLSTLIKSQQTDKAIYGQGTFAITDRIHFTAGARHSWASRKVTTGLTNADFFVFNGVPMPLPISGRSPNTGTITSQVTPTEEKNTYNLALDWQLTDNWLLYVTNRTGYKPGGINQNAPAGNPNRTFGPENLTDVELGTKLRWSLGGITGRSSLALFRDNYKSIQTSSVIPGTATTITINNARARIQGAEFETAAHVSEFLDVTGWYAYLDAHYTSFIQNFACSASSEYWYPQCATAPAGANRQLILDHAHGTVNIIDASGATIAAFSGPADTFANAAKHTFSIQPTVHLDPWVGQKIAVTANIQYTSSQRIPNSQYPGITLAPAPAGAPIPSEGPFFMPSRTTVDLRADWKNVMNTKLNASFVVTNLTNKLYNISNSSGFTIGGGFEYIYNEPRMVYLELNYPIGGAD